MILRRVFAHADAAKPAGKRLFRSFITVASKMGAT